MDDSIAFFQENDIDVTYQKDGFYTSENTNIQFSFLREKDIALLINKEALDAGIIGYNTFLEAGKGYEEQKLGFSSCRMVIAVPNESDIQTVRDLQNKSFATSYPLTLKKNLGRKGVKFGSIEKYEGSVETIARLRGTDAIFDIVETGNSLRANGFRELVTLVESEAVFITSKILHNQLFQSTQKSYQFYDRYENLCG